MTERPTNSWQDLFAADDGQGPAETLELRIVKRGGQPFLILPADPTTAVLSLDLYAAQTARARIARKILRWAIHRGRKTLSTRASLRIGLDDPFVHFLQNLAHGTPGRLPAFGALAGNPNAPGQRFILMVFNPAQKPAAVVKAGLTDAAKKLIEAEATFLESVPGGTLGVPALRARFEHPRLCALAMDFIEGESPRTNDEVAIPALLGSWLNPHKTVPIALTNTWWELEQICATHPVFASLAKQLANRIVHPTIFHGDLVPWNVKVRSGDWFVLDWERGNLSGLPGYDWFHYLIQTRILVEKKSTRALTQELAELLKSSAFQQYAARAGIIGVERELVLAYLLHHNEVIHPGEGLAQGRKLLQRLALSWLGIGG